MNIPKNAKEYIGQFIIFFSDEEEPKVLFSSAISSEVYEEAERIKKKLNKNPVVLRIADTDSLSVSFALRS